MTLNEIETSSKTFYNSFLIFQKLLMCFNNSEKKKKNALKQLLHFLALALSFSVGRFPFGGTQWFSLSLLRLPCTFIMNSGLLTAGCSLLSAVTLCRTALFISIKK